jgi:proteasome lid subunit RPN8/RPN11
VPRLRLDEELAERLRAIAAETYPYECCGALLGRDAADSREVKEIVPLPNRREDSRRNRFSMTAEDVREAERAARRCSLDVVGWYHSHPDHPAQPSEYDREHAWPWYSYVIVSVEAGTPQEITCWRLTHDRRRFETEALEIAAPPAVSQASSRT